MLGTNIHRIGQDQHFPWTENKTSREKEQIVNVSQVYLCVIPQIILILLSDKPSTFDELSQASAPLSLVNVRSRSADRKVHRKNKGERTLKDNMEGNAQLNSTKSLEWSQDSGNSSLNTSTTNSRRSGKTSDYIKKEEEEVPCGRRNENCERCD